MTSALDVAAYILRKQGELSAMKLQKLVYYSHAWHLVWDERPLFEDRIEAWANGPVVPALYREHRLQFSVAPADITKGDPGALSASERESVDAVLDHYGKLSAHQLSELTHREAPWKCARLRGGLRPGERGSVVITNTEMAEYYDGLTDVDG